LLVLVGRMFLFIFSLFFCFFLYVFFWGRIVLDFFVVGVFGIEVSFGFVFDFVSLGFFMFVSFVSGIVFFYSLMYMEGTIDMRRFGFLVFLFVFSMFLLVFSSSFFLCLVG